VWALGIALAFILGYMMGVYEAPDDPSDDMVADVREDPINTYTKVGDGDDYGFHRRKKNAKVVRT